MSETEAEDTVKLTLPSAFVTELELAVGRAYSDDGPQVAGPVEITSHQLTALSIYVNSNLLSMRVTVRPEKRDDGTWVVIQRKDL